MFTYSNRKWQVYQVNEAAFNARLIRSVVRQTARQMVTEAAVTEQIRLDKTLEVFGLGEMAYQSASALATATAQYGFDWSEVQLEVVTENDSTRVYFYEPELNFYGLVDTDIRYLELSAVWGVDFTPEELSELNQALTDSIEKRAAHPRYYELARKNLPASLRLIEQLVEESFQAEFVFVPKIETPANRTEPNRR